MLKEKKITYLVGKEEVINRPLVPYDPLVCDFFADLSSKLRSDKKATAYPDIMALAFWLRRANITKLKDNFEDGRARLGLGLIFHIAPSNVPVNFAFSFVFGMLSGNANIVKVPSKSFPQIEIICLAIKRLLKEEKYQKIRDMNAFVKYHDRSEITAEFSSRCNGRLIWGGDETIRNVRTMPIPIRSVEVAFSDRYSFCIMDADSVMKIDELELKRLAENFYNDTYLMDQNACSSPHLIVWLGKQKEEAQERFWQAVYQIAIKRYELATVRAVDKYTLFCQDAIDLTGFRKFSRHGNHLYRIAIDKLPSETDSLRGKCGYFYEYNANEIDELTSIVNTKYQTLTYFGVDKRQILDFIIRNRLSGIDRIVPIGKALDIGIIWDGYDIVKTLSRIIEV